MVRTVLAAALILTGCASMSGRTEGTAIPAPQKLDCDLIFPAPAPDPFTP
jgi:hypothetical protein